MSLLELVKKIEANIQINHPKEGKGYERNEKILVYKNKERTRKREYEKNERNEKTPSFLSQALPYLSMPLDEFQARGCPLEIRVPWLDVTLWFVPGEADAEALAQEGVSRGRVWTANELINLMSISDETPGMVRTLTHAKLAMAGEISEVRTR